MDKLREEFEEWFNKEMVLHISTSNETVVRLMWKAWQASRASIVVDFDEPPFYAVKKDSTPIDNIRYGAELAIEQARRSIGLSIKGE